MKILTKQPSGKYYTRIVSGGLNGAVAGSPTIKGANVLCNCVGFANGRFNQIINDPDLTGINKAFRYQLVCNAENFIESAKRQGLKISSVPVQGGIMVWQKGKTLGGGDGAGHVAVVEEVYNDGTILTSESGWASWAFKTVRRSNSNGRWGQASAYKFRGCIINPSVTLKTVPAPKLTVDGIGGKATVRALQKFLGTPADGEISGQTKSLAKYHPALKATEYGKGGSTCVKYLQKWLGIKKDGQWGKTTSKALQEVIGIDNDGIFGEASMRALQKYLNTHDKAQYPTKKAEQPKEQPKKNNTVATTVVTAQTPQDKACAWAKKIAADNSYHYVRYGLGKKAHECPVCHKHAKGKYHGWNCIGFAFACWRHGAKIKCKCSCDAMTDQLYKKALNASKANALKIVKDRLNIKDIKLIRSKSGIPLSKLKKGDIITYWKGGKYVHTALYLGNGKIADCTSGRKDNIKYGAKSYTKWKIKLAIRYTGN